jgi:hypothetical protein
MGCWRGGARYDPELKSWVCAKRSKAEPLDLEESRAHKYLGAADWGGH